MTEMIKFLILTTAFILTAVKLFSNYNIDQFQVIILWLYVVTDQIYNLNKEV